MDNPPSPPPNNTPAPAAEELQPRTVDSAPPPVNPPDSKAAKKLLHRSYRPSHKATLIGIAVVMLILAVNAVVIGLVLKKQAKKDDLVAKGQVSISASELNQLGINRGNIGDSGVLLTVAPDAQFKGKLSVGGN